MSAAVPDTHADVCAFPAATRRCSKCGELLGLVENFHRDKRGRSGRAAQCKDCVTTRRYQREGRSPSADRLLAIARDALCRISKLAAGCPEAELAERVDLIRGAADSAIAQLAPARRGEDLHA